MNHHEICDPPRSKRSDSIQPAKKFRAVRRSDVDGLERRETRFYEQLHFALVAESRDDSTVAGWVESCEQLSARLNKGMLELHLFFKQDRPAGSRRPVGD